MKNKIQFDHTQQRKKELNKYLNEMYLDYFNNFISVERFAEYYNISETFALEVIEQGRQINHKQ
jgi:hypothetical protein